jgi:hypothetical protein
MVIMKIGSILPPSIAGNSIDIARLEMLSVCTSAPLDGTATLFITKRSAVDGLRTMRGSRRSI